MLRHTKWPFAKLAGRIGAMAALALALSAPLARPIHAAGSIQPMATVTADGRFATVDIFIDNPDGLKVGFLDIKGSVPEGMSFVSASSDGSFDGTAAGWDSGEVKLGEDQISGFAYTLDTGGKSGTALVTVMTTRGEVNGIYKVAVPIKPSDNWKDLSPVTVRGSGPIQPMATVTTDGRFATVDILIDNPDGLKVGFLDIKGSVPEGMSFVSASSDGSFDGTAAGWDSGEVKLGEDQISGFAYTLDTGGKSGTALVTVMTTRGEVNGIYKVAVPIKPSDNWKDLSPVTVRGSGPIQPVLKITPHGRLVTVDILVDNPDGLKVGFLDIKGSVPKGMSFASASSEGSLDGGIVGWVSERQEDASQDDEEGGIDEEATSGQGDQSLTHPRTDGPIGTRSLISGFSYTIDTEGMSGTALVTITTSEGEVNGVYQVAAPIKAVANGEEQSPTTEGSSVPSESDESD